MTNKKHNHKQSLFGRIYYLTKEKKLYFNKFTFFVTLNVFQCININNKKMKLNCY